MLSLTKDRAGASPRRLTGETTYRFTHRLAKLVLLAAGFLVADR